jgi:hypothetical protein
LGLGNVSVVLCVRNGCDGEFFGMGKAHIRQQGNAAGNKQGGPEKALFHGKTILRGSVCADGLLWQAGYGENLSARG